MLTVRLTRVPENGEQLRESRRVSLADLGLAAPFDPAGVDASWELTRMMGKVYGKVRGEGLLHLSCGRCLRDFSRAAVAEFAVLFEPRAFVGKGRDNQARPQGEEEEEAGPTAAFFDGEDLPVGEELRQELELEVPFSALCRERCAGLCPSCGANLNDGPCACPTAGAEGPA